MAEALNETAFGIGLVVRGTHYVISGDPASQSATDRLLVQEQILSAWTFFTSTTMTLDEWKKIYNMEVRKLLVIYTSFWIYFQINLISLSNFN